MLRFLTLLMGLAGGAVLGLALTVATLAGKPPFGAVTSGPWTAWPAAGTPAIDPYARALYAHEGRVPLATTAGLRFFATTDDAGQLLKGRCRYSVAGPTPPAQFWTLTMLDPDGFARPGILPRVGFTSAELDRAVDGSAVVDLSRDARPGNWLPTRSDGPFVLMLSIYETPLGPTLLGGGEMPALPSIARTSCS